MELIVANLSSKVRRGTLLGRPHLVADGTLIVPGVLHGSMGPLLYPEEEVKANVQAWNGMPLVVYHPGTRGATARSPDVLNRQGIGLLLNARYDGALRGEYWFDEERLLAVDQRVFDDLVNGRKIEISTGLGTTNDKAPEGSVWNSPSGPVEYEAVARNLRPDHVAILPDQVGACSLKDGCGVLNHLANELSQDDVRSALYAQLVEKFGSSSEEDELWLVDVYGSYAIYHSQEGMFRLGYSMVDEKVKLSDDSPVAVQRKTVYEPVTNLDGQVGSSVSNFKEEPDMAEKMKDTERKVVIDGLISNSCCWTEADRKELEGMTDNQLKRTKESADKATENETLLAAAEKGFNDGRDEVNFNREKREWSKTTNKEPEKKDPIMTPEQQEALNYGLQKMQEDKDALIKQIVGNAEGAEVKTQFLSTKSIGELRQIASLIPEPQAQNHYGPNPTGSRKGASIDREDHLVPPDIDWVQNSAFATKRS